MKSHHFEKLYAPKNVRIKIEKLPNKSLFTVDEHATHCENASPVGKTVEYRLIKPRIVCGTIPRHESASGIDSSRSARINAGH